MKKNALSPDFWANFAKSNWEKKPLVARDFNSPLQKIDEAQIFLMLVRYSDHCRKMKTADGFKFYVDGQRLHESEVLQFLPAKSDSSLKNYHLRMEEIFSDYCLVCDELLQVSQPHWKELKNFTQSLFSAVGFPNRFVEIGLYLGNYRKTPFGVHVDGCGVFSFPVLGKKVFRLWKPEFAEKNPSLNRSQSYAKFKKFSQTLTAGPGDMVYWPSSAWHIAESNGSFSATWSLGVWVDRTHQQNIESALAPLLKMQLGSSGAATAVTSSPVLKSGQIRQLPKNYSNSISVIKKLSKNDLHDAFMRSWITLQSTDGFKSNPEVKVKKLISMSSKLQITDSKKILWCHLKTGTKTLLAYQGTLVETEASHQLLKLIEDLNLEKYCAVSDYLSGPSKKRDLNALKNLSAAGAFNP